MPENKSIVENWILENESKLKEISVENVPLYESIFSALNYLNNSLGGKVITAPIIEPLEISEPIKSNSVDKKVYLISNVRGNDIIYGSVGDVLDEYDEEYLIAWYKDEYEKYDGEYGKRFFTDIDPIFKIGDKVSFPVTQFQTELGTPAMEMIVEAEINGYDTLEIVDLNFNWSGDNVWRYWLSNAIRQSKIGFNLQDLQTLKTALQVKPQKTSKPRSKYKKGQVFINKVDPTSIYEIIDLRLDIDDKKFIYRLSSKTDVTKLNYWTTETDLEKDYNISQKKSISLPIKTETITQQVEFEDLADELNNLDI
jgi:hypothetical protein